MLPWKQADSVHLNALLREQLPSGVPAETHRSVEALGRGRGGGYTLIHPVLITWGAEKPGWEREGAGDNLLSQLSQQGLKRVKHLGRKSLPGLVFAQPVCTFIVQALGKACWLLEAVQAPGLFAAAFV